jgi:hypothetical protein
MAACVYCRAETELYDSGVPICPKCSDAREVTRKPPQNTDQIHLTLVSRIAEATAKVSAANEKFNEALNRFPGGPAHPDGVQRDQKCVERSSRRNDGRAQATK